MMEYIREKILQIQQLSSEVIGYIDAKTNFYNIKSTQFKQVNSKETLKHENKQKIYKHK